MVTKYACGSEDARIGLLADVTYIGKSKKQLELAYYVGGIGIMLLFIFKAMNNNQ